MDGDSTTFSLTRKAEPGPRCPRAASRMCGEVPTAARVSVSGAGGSADARGQRCPPRSRPSPAGGTLPSPPQDLDSVILKGQTQTDKSHAISLIPGIYIGERQTGQTRRQDDGVAVTEGEGRGPDAGGGGVERGVTDQTGLWATSTRGGCRCCVLEVCARILRNLINQHHPNKFNKKNRANFMPGSFPSKKSPDF